MGPREDNAPNEQLERVNTARVLWLLAFLAALPVWAVSCSTSRFAERFDGRTRCFFPRHLIAYETPEGVVVRLQYGEPSPPQDWIELGAVGFASTREIGVWGRATRVDLALLRPPYDRALSDADMPSYRESAAAALERLATERNSPALLRCAAMMRAGVQEASHPNLAGWLHNAVSLGSAVLLCLAPFRLRSLACRARWLRAPAPGVCPACRYDCSGCPTAACCPECGLARA